MAVQVCTICLSDVHVTTWCLECRNSYVNELGLETHPTAVAAWAAKRARIANTIEITAEIDRMAVELREARDARQHSDATSPEPAPMVERVGAMTLELRTPKEGG